MDKKSDYTILNEDILGGLKSALSNGESLQSAMQSFYNAGYKKEDIEKAAASIQTNKEQAQPIQTTDKIQKSFFSKFKFFSRNSKINIKENNGKLKNTRSKQAISGYGEEPVSNKRRILILGLIFILLVLIGILAGIFLFKEEFLSFFSNLLS